MKTKGQMNATRQDLRGLQLISPNSTGVFIHCSTLFPVAEAQIFLSGCIWVGWALGWDEDEDEIEMKYLHSSGGIEVRSAGGRVWVKMLIATSAAPKGRLVI